MNLFLEKNLVILTASLIGAYDLNFTFLSRYYASHPVNEVPSLYIDLQLPAFNPKHEIHQVYVFVCLIMIMMMIMDFQKLVEKN